MGGGRGRRRGRGGSGVRRGEGGQRALGHGVRHLAARRHAHAVRVGPQHRVRRLQEPVPVQAAVLRTVGLAMHAECVTSAADVVRLRTLLVERKAACESQAMAVVTSRCSAKVASGTWGRRTSHTCTAQSSTSAHDATWYLPHHTRHCARTSSLLSSHLCDSYEIHVQTTKLLINNFDLLLLRPPFHMADGCYRIYGVL